MKLERKQVLQLAAEAMADPRTIEKIYAGEKTERKTQVRERVVAAAKKLKMPAPPAMVSE